MISKLLSSENRRIFSLAFFSIALTEVCVSVALQMFESTFSLHIDSINYPAFVAGSVIGAGAVSASALRFFGGSLCEKMGRKRLLIAGLVIFTSMLFFVGRISSLFMIYLVTIIQMGGYSMASTAISVMIVDVVPRESLGKGMGYFGLATSLAGAVGPSMALAAFTSRGAFRTVSCLGSMISVLGLLITLFLIRYQEPEKKSINPGVGADYTASSDPGTVPLPKYFWHFIEKSALPASLINGLAVSVECLISMFITLFAQRNSIADAGLFFTISVFFIVITKVLSGRLSDRYNVLVAFLPGAASLVLCFILLVFSPQLHILFFLAGAFYGTGSGLVTPCLNAEAVRSAPLERASVASSTFFLPMDLSMIIGSILWGGMIDLVDFKASYIIACAIVIVSAAVAIPVLGKKKTSTA